MRPIVEALERRTGKPVEFLNVEACILFRSADECGQGRPSELKGLKKVFIDDPTRPADQKIIRSELENLKAGLEILDSRDGAEIILQYSSARYVDPGCPCEAGRGEVAISKGPANAWCSCSTG